MKIQEIFSGLDFGLDHGIMEEWNVGIVGFQRILSILHFFVPPSADHLSNPAVSSPSRRIYVPAAKTHLSNIPVFHHSKRGDAPNL